MTRPVALVTGAYGFVGRHVARRLSTAGYHVRAVGHGAWVREEWREWGVAEWHVADVTTDALVTYAGEPDLIVHCAGSGSVAFSMTHPYQDFGRTVSTTLSVLEFVRLHAPASRIVIPSSAGVYGVVERVPIRVTDERRPASPYGLHKAMAEDLCRSYAHHFGLKAAMVRLFSVYGIGIRKQLLWDACSKMALGDMRFAGTGRETRDWVHVEDAADLLLVAGERASSECPVANGGAGKGVEIRSILGMIADCLGADGAPAFTGATRPGDPVHYTADLAEARDWGWQPRRSLAEGVAAYVDWFKAGAT